MRKLLMIGAAGIATALAVATPASAFECYNTNRSAQGNTSAAAAPALMSFEEILADPEIVGLPCQEGIDYVLAGLDAAGFRTDVLINGRTIMASGLEKKHPEMLQDGSGIDHLSDDFFDTVEPLIGAAFGICAA